MLRVSDQPILCGVDGSPESHAAANLAATLASRLGAPLMLAHVVPHAAIVSPPPVGAAAFGAAALIRHRAEAAVGGRDLLEQMAAKLPVRPALELATGDPPRRLVGLGDAAGAGMIVLGTKRRGAVARALRRPSWCRVVRLSHAAVAVVGSGSDISCEGPVVVGYDGGEHSERAVAFAADLANRLGQRLHVVTVTADHRPQEPSRSPVLRRSVLGAEWEVRAGEPTRELCRAVAAVDPALVVTGSRGRGPWRSALLGSASASVTQHAPRPVVVVRGAQDP